MTEKLPFVLRGVRPLLARTLQPTGLDHLFAREPAAAPFSLDVHRPVRVYRVPAGTHRRPWRGFVGVARPAGVAHPALTAA